MVPGDVHVRLVLPRKARTLEVDADEVRERFLIVTKRIGDGSVAYALHTGNREVQGRVFGGAGLLFGALLLRLFGRVGRNGLVGGLPLLRAASG